jgi:hypothetical protein
MNFKRSSHFNQRLFLFRLKVAFGVAAISSLFSYSLAKCEGQVCVVANKYKLPLTKQFSTNTPLLRLISSGMRVKNVLINVNVYKIGIYITPVKEESLRSLKFPFKFNEEIPKPVDQSVSLAVSLSFVRHVGTSTMVDALVDAMAVPVGDPTYQQTLHQFKSLLGNIISSDGLKAGDELNFLFTGKDGLELVVIYKNKSVGAFSNRELRQRLANVYLGENAICVEVTENLRNYFSNTIHK